MESSCSFSELTVWESQPSQSLMNVWLNFHEISRAINSGLLLTVQLHANPGRSSGKMTMPYHTQLSAPAPITTGPEFNSPSYKSLAISGAGRAAHISNCSPPFRKWPVPVQQPAHKLAYIQRGLNRRFPVVLTTYVSGTSTKHGFDDGSPRAH